MKRESRPEQEQQVLWVHLVSTQTESGAPEVKVTCILRNGTVEFEGESGFIENLKQGITLGPGRTILPAEGKIFLEGLLMQYRHPYLFVTPIRSGDRVVPYQP